MTLKKALNRKALARFYYPETPENSAIECMLNVTHDRVVLFLAGKGRGFHIEKSFILPSTREEDQYEVINLWTDVMFAPTPELAVIPGYIYIAFPIDCVWNMEIEILPAFEESRLQSYEKDYFGRNDWEFSYKSLT